MGKTVPSYRMAIECEIDTWKAFRNTLSREKDVEAFDTLMDMARAHASAGGCAVNPVLFEPMLMSIVLDLRTQIEALCRSSTNSYGRNPLLEWILRNRLF